MFHNTSAIYTHCTSWHASDGPRTTSPTYRIKRTVAYNSLSLSHPLEARLFLHCFCSRNKHLDPQLRFCKNVNLNDSTMSGSTARMFEKKVQKSHQDECITSARILRAEYSTRVSLILVMKLNARPCKFSFIRGV
jgi:hypothetical protein